MKNSGESEAKLKEYFEKFMKENPSLGSENLDKVKEDEKEKAKVVVDTKIEAAFERLRNDNLYIWKQSLSLAQEEFNQKGVGETMNFLPKTLLDKTDLKRTINSLILDEDAKPKAIL